MPAPTSSRTLWKGAISFGLVHIPVTLHSATAENRMKFNLLNKSTMTRVGNQQVDKSSGEAMPREEIVKGFEVEKDQFVVLTPDEIKAALPKSTQTISIEAFVDRDAVPAVFFHKPYYVSPGGKGGQKPFALLRETLARTGKVGIARVVISTKQHLAALIPQDQGLVLNLLRWSDEVRDVAGLAWPGEDVGVSAAELKMAEQLVEAMAGEWQPDLFHDEFREKLMELVEQKQCEGGVRQVAPLPGEEVPAASAEVIDLTELLRRSLKGNAAAAPAAAPAAKKSAAAKREEAANDDAAPVRKAAARKTGTTARASVKPATPRRKNG
ncbi:non-homologous end joining protein Ku [Ramlibacter alkalitolerans]|uniref:Non-homologous end joining protein Ku n=1 Tax=Ramlibacter alkalitolerans TaxID=2039631 RepID=A0ABS1JLC0_9BURK|nr:Ku protein [Ramlibacter alkalitolerans]MBL0425039.1 Ku protein [Ramlibacter alkalitolerans]